MYQFDRFDFMNPAKTTRHTTLMFRQVNTLFTLNEDSIKSITFDLFNYSFLPGRLFYSNTENHSENLTYSESTQVWKWR